MNNIILFAMNDEQIKKMKSFDSIYFFEQFESKKGKHHDIQFITHISTEKEVKTNLVLNSDGFLKLKDSNYDLFKSFSDFEPYEKTIEGMLGENLISQSENKQNLHLFALFEKDISEYKNDPNLFKTMAKYVRETKKENKISKKDFISVRIIKSKDSPFCYLASLSDKFNLLIQVKNELITFISQSNK